MLVLCNHVLIPKDSSLDLCKPDRKLHIDVVTLLHLQVLLGYCTVSYNCDFDGGHITSMHHLSNVSINLNDIL